MEEEDAITRYCAREHGSSVDKAFAASDGKAWKSPDPTVRHLASALRRCSDAVGKGAVFFDGQGDRVADFLPHLEGLKVGVEIHRLRPTLCTWVLNVALHGLGISRVDRAWADKAYPGYREAPSAPDRMVRTAREWGKYSTDGCLLILTVAEPIRPLLRQIMPSAEFREAEVILPPIRMVVDRVERKLEIPMMRLLRPEVRDSPVRCDVVWLRIFPCSNQQD